MLDNSIFPRVEKVSNAVSLFNEQCNRNEYLNKMNKFNNR